LKFAENICLENRGTGFDSFTHLGSYDKTKVRKDLALIIDTAKLRGLPLEEVTRRLNSPTPIPEMATVFVLNGNLFQRRSSFCAQASSSKLGIISKYRNVQGDIVVRTRCFGTPVRALGHTYITIAANKCKTMPISQISRPESYRLSVYIR
jgi:hypothetical protein